VVLEVQEQREELNFILHLLILLVVEEEEILEMVQMDQQVLVEVEDLEHHLLLAEQLHFMLAAVAAVT